MGVHGQRDMLVQRRGAPVGQQLLPVGKAEQGLVPSLCRADVQRLVRHVAEGVGRAMLPVSLLHEVKGQKNIAQPDGDRRSLPRPGTCGTEAARIPRQIRLAASGPRRSL